MIRFRDKLAEEWLRTKPASLLHNLKAQWRGTVQDALAVGIERGTSPLRVSLELSGRVNPETGLREGGSIELDDSEKETLRRFERCLTQLDLAYFEYDLRDKRYDQSMNRAIQEDIPLIEERNRLIVSRLEAKLLKSKADIIARTEMLAAISRSEWLSTKAAIEKSDLPELAVARIWESCGAEDVRPSHKSLDGQRIVGFRQCFVSSITGAKLMYPGDRSLGALEEEVRGCRCRIRYDIDYLYHYRKSENQ